MDTSTSPSFYTLYIFSLPAQCSKPDFKVSLIYSESMKYLIFDISCFLLETKSFLPLYIYSNWLIHCLALPDDTLILFRQWYIQATRIYTSSTHRPCVLGLLKNRLPRGCVSLTQQFAKRIVLPTMTRVGKYSYLGMLFVVSRTVCLILRTLLTDWSRDMEVRALDGPRHVLQGWALWFYIYAGGTVEPHR